MGHFLNSFQVGLDCKYGEILVMYIYLLTHSLLTI